MAQSIFKSDLIKKTFMDKISKLPPVEREAAIIAWNLILAKSILTLTAKVNDLVLKKSRDVISTAKKKAKLALLDTTSTSVKNTVKDPAQVAISGYKDPVLDSLKTALFDLGTPALNKSMLLKNIINRSSAQDILASNEITKTNNDIASLNKLKI